MTLKLTLTDPHDTKTDTMLKLTLDEKMSCDGTGTSKILDRQLAH